MKYKFIYHILLQIIFSIVFNSCGTISTYEQEPIHKQINDIIGKWKLQSIKSIGQPSFKNISSSQTNITLEINNEYRIYGYSGCNSFSGIVEVNGSIIRFSSFMSTSKGCPGNPSIEKIVFDVLSNTNNYEVRGNMLYLKYDKKVLAIYIATLKNN